MFDRTILILKKCETDARAFAYLATLITQSFFVLYYVSALALSLGHPIVYSVLLALTAAALIFFLCTESISGIKPIKMRRQIRIVIRYAKYCVHLVAVCLALHSFYTAPQTVSPLSLILFILAILALLIQMIGELVGFLSRRYFEELLAAALADTELIRSVLDKVQSGADTYHRVKGELSSFSDRAAEKAGAFGARVKKRLSFFKRKKKDAPIIVEAEESGVEEDVPIESNIR
ncbi:MAG: hypothetical protein J6K14_04840 [Clostridia bacterium]|nr:hypothetical protein [Clostridia bacterium]